MVAYMIPILFSKDATQFNTLGLYRLPDAESCIVTEERNGEFELELVYPVDGLHYKDIEDDMIIVARPSDGGSKQSFRIYRHEVTIDGRCVFNARHISYELNVKPIPARSHEVAGAQAMMEDLASVCPVNVPFTFWSDITGTRSYKISTPVSLRGALGGVEGSVLDNYGGEFEWDNWTVKLHSARGADTGVRITYGKNLTGLRATVDIGGTITGVMAYYQGQDKTVYSDPLVVSVEHSYAHDRIAVLDVSGEFSNTPTSAQVTEKANSYLNSTTTVDPNMAIEVDFVALWQTDEYRQFAPLERVKLCDTVYISYKQLGVTVKKKVTRTVYNVLADRYDSIELGGQSTIVDTITGLMSDKDITETKGYSNLIATEDVPVSITYAAGNIGTRGATESLGTTIKAGYMYIGAYILDNRNTSIFNATIQGNEPNATAHLCVYRGTGNAVNNASVTVRKVWMKTAGA